MRDFAEFCPDFFDKLTRNLQIPSLAAARFFGWQAPRSAVKIGQTRDRPGTTICVARESGTLKIALYYDDSAYQELLQQRQPAAPEQPAGLMGRQVAGKEFLNAYLSHGDWDELVGLTPNAGSAASLKHTCRTHPSSPRRPRRLQVFSVPEFRERFLDDSPATQLYFPCPPDSRFAWMRHQQHPAALAISGVTHTLCSLRALESLRNLVTAPWLPFDRLICTSRAVRQMVEDVTDAWSEFLRQRDGGRARCRMPLETIPLGVDTERFHPAAESERHAQRARLGIGTDEIVVLFVGRLSHHAKAHPFPLYHALAAAARETGRQVHLLMVGWAANTPVREGFENLARVVAPQLRVSFLNGLQQENRFGAWSAADVFCSLSDNIQETFGLVIIEAMASGLPVVATDWNGYRDLVVHDETGFLIPTSMVAGATRDLTSRLIMGEVNYDHFLAVASQAVSVDCAATTRAFITLFEDVALRRRMGAAGRDRVLQHFAWPVIVRAYESLWAQQEQERQRFEAGKRLTLRRSRRADPLPNGTVGPALYPAPEQSFAGYPTRWLNDNSRLITAPSALARLGPLLHLPLTSHEADSRTTDVSVLRALCETARPGCSLQQLEAQLLDQSLGTARARATLAWMLKYDLLRYAPVEEPDSASPAGRQSAPGAEADSSAVDAE